MSYFSQEGSKFKKKKKYLLCYGFQAISTNDLEYRHDNVYLCLEMLGNIAMMAYLNAQLALGIHGQ